MDDAWMEAVIDACVIDCIGWDVNDPRKTLRELIEWEVRIALDPQVSGEAQALIEQGRKEALEGKGTTAINTCDAYAVSQEVYWRYDSPPRGVKLFLLTKGGVAITGDWRDNAGFIAWLPLPRRNKEEEKRLGLT